ncbi:MAG: class I SAM-dependent methyltransferase [Nitrospiraceae bacterium]
MKRLPLWRRPYFADRILDIGAGHNPFQGVTHVVEIDPSHGGERGGNQLVVPESAKLIVGDVIALPFPSASFDYVYASHVLEHVLSPEAACGEIMRVGRAGYIETPSPFLEQGLALMGKEPPETWYHRWLVFALSSDLLVFEPKTPEAVAQFCSCADGQFMREFYSAVEFGEAQHCFRRKAKTTMVYWRSCIRIEVRKWTADCQRDGLICRFRGMKRALLANCNDLLRAARVMRLQREFPRCAGVFRKYGHKTVFVG